MKLLGLSLLLLATGAGSSAEPAAPVEPSKPDLDVLRQLNRSFVEIARKVSPSVVVINVEQKELPISVEDAEAEERWNAMPPGSLKEFHEQLRSGPREKTTGQGSGIVIREDGYILTN